MYVGHSAHAGAGCSVRRRTSGRLRTTEIKQCSPSLVDEAMTAGALGFSSSHAHRRTSTSLTVRCPAGWPRWTELRALADAVGIHARGSIAYAPGQRRRRASMPRDRELLIELAARGGVPVITQGLGGRSKVDAPTQGLGGNRGRSWTAPPKRGAPVYSLLMTRAFNGPVHPAGRDLALRRGAALARADGAGLGRRAGSGITDRGLARAATSRPSTTRTPTLQRAPRLPPPIWDVLSIEETNAPGARCGLMGHRSGRPGPRTGHVHPGRRHVRPRTGRSGRRLPLDQ